MTSSGNDAFAPPSRSRRILTLRWVLPLIVGLIAIVCGAALPLAPVEQSHVTVSWPAEGAARQSTALLLTNQTPHELAVDFSADAVASAAASGSLVLATVEPTDPEADLGLRVVTDGGLLTVSTADRSESWPVEGTWSIRSSIDGFVVAQDGAEVARWNVPPPQVDGLLTDVAPEVGGLSAQLQVVDDSASRPTGVKIGIITIALLAVIATAVLIGWDDRRARAASSDPNRRSARRTAALRGMRSLGAADLLVVGALVLWALIGPMTDDDGYYATMGLNAQAAGYVGNYFQMFNQPFTPFTWLWEFFGFWQQVGGRSPFWLRVPALVLGIVAWFVTRTLLERLRGPVRRIWGELLRVALAFVFVAWWASYSMGVRPEPVAAVSAVIVVALLVRAHERRTLFPGAIAVAVAASAFAAHPIGIVAAAPLMVSIPMLWRIARERGAVLPALARTVAVASASIIALLLAFSDGSLYGMQSSQQRFALVEQPQDWTDEISRYGLLLADIPMGSYAKRVVVLIALVLLVWFLVYAAWTRRAAVYSAPSPLALVGWSFGVSFILMWITTSKWTHHFGSLAALGPLFIGAMVLVVPRLIAAHLPAGGRIAPWLAPLVVASLFPATILALRGPDTWAYEWGEALRQVQPPRLLGIGLGNVIAWGFGAVLLLVAFIWWSRRRSGAGNTAHTLYAVSGFVVIVFTLTSVSLFTSFLRMVGPGAGFTPNQASLSDPLGGRCLPDQEIRLWDAASGAPLDELEPADQTTGFRESTGATASPPGADRLTFWSSQDDDSVGTFTSGWFEYPSTPDDERVGVLTRGDLTETSEMRLSVETREDGQIVRTPLVDAADRPGWSTMLIEGLTPGERFRLVGEDLSAETDSDLDVSVPVTMTPTTMADLSSPGDPTAVSWMQSFWFPCDRPVTIAQGVIEPPVLATSFGPSGIDNIWVNYRGGSLAGVKRLAIVNTPATGLGRTAYSGWGRVHEFTYRMATNAYDLEQTWVFTPGWKSGLDPASQVAFAPQAP